MISRPFHCSYVCVDFVPFGFDEQVHLFLQPQQYENSLSRLFLDGCFKLAVYYVICYDMVDGSSCEFFPTLECLFIVGIMFISIDQVKETLYFLVLALKLKSPARIIFFRFLLFLENRYLHI